MQRHTGPAPGIMQWGGIGYPSRTPLVHICRENASQVPEIANGVYGADTVTANYVQFWFSRFHSGIFNVKDAPRIGRPIVENVDKTTEIIEVDWPVRSRSIAQELKIDHKTVLSYLRRVRFKKKLHVWVPHQLTPKNMMDRISIYEALAKRIEIDPFLKRMVTRDEKWVTYYNIVRKRLTRKLMSLCLLIAKSRKRKKVIPDDPDQDNRTKLHKPISRNYGRSERPFFSRQSQIKRQNQWRKHSNSNLPFSRDFGPITKKQASDEKKKKKGKPINRNRGGSELPFFRATRGLLATDHVILNHGQVTWTTPELAPPFLTTTPHQREDVSALDRFNGHRCPTWRVFSGTRTRDKASHDLIPIPLGYRSHMTWVNPIKRGLDELTFLIALAHQLIDRYSSRKRKRRPASFQAKKRVVPEDVQLASGGNRA
ncbi:histone-lysine N-methyltransferase SETMAR [Trichonephila clavipes]|nr:histone-lysine N-methyltransferase SETMAR [Trichonephila clavipes]